MIRIASWNVNSLRVRLEQVVEYLLSNQIDILCLQETKVIDDDFPIEVLEKAGYKCSFIGQKTYNGVAIISKNPPDEVLLSFSKKFEEEKENPNKSITKPKSFINGSLKNSGVKLKDIKEELEKVNETKS